MKVTARTIADWYGWSRWKAWRWLCHLEKSGKTTPSGTPVVRRGGKAGKTLYTTRKLLEFVKEDVPTRIDSLVENRLLDLENFRRGAESMQSGTSRDMLNLRREVREQGKQLASLTQQVIDLKRVVASVAAKR